VPWWAWWAWWVIPLALFILGLVTVPLLLRAADTSNANYTATLDITNQGVSRTEYPAAANISGAALVDAAIIEADALNTVVQKGGQEIPAMPPNNRIVVEGTVACTGGGVICTEYTAEARNVDLNDVPLLATVPVSGDAVYFGFDNPARILTLDIGTVSTHNLTLVWQYATSSGFINLSNVDDRSNEFSRLGRRTVSWDAPTTNTPWFEGTITGSARVAFWVRAVAIDIVATGTAPRANQAFYENGQWWVWDNSLAAQQQEQYTLFLGGPDMVTRHQTFPGIVGVTTADAAAIEPGDIYSIEIIGRLTLASTGTGVNVCVVCKLGAITLTVTGSQSVNGLSLGVTGSGTTRFDVLDLTLPATGSQTISIDSNGTEVTVLVSGLAGGVSRTNSGPAQNITNNANTWQWVTNEALRYFDSIKLFGESLLEVTEYDSQGEWNLGTFSNTESQATTPPTDPEFSRMVESTTGDGEWIEGTSEFFNSTAEGLLPAFGYDGSGGRTSSNAFFRFTGVPFAQGQSVGSAVVELMAGATNTSTGVSVLIRALAEDNATAPVSFADAEARTRTTASVTWNPVPSFTIDVAQQTPDISTVIQEVVNRAGWTSGNAIVVYIEDSGTPAVANRLRQSNGVTTPNSAARLLLTPVGGTLAGSGFIQLARRGLTNSVTDPPEFWGKTATATPFDFRVVTDHLRFGDYAHQFDADDAAGGAAEAYLSQTLAASPGQIWSAGMWITERSTAFSKVEFIRLRWRNSGGATISTVESTVPLDGGPDYTFHQFNAQTAPAGTASVMVEAGQRCTAACISGRDVWIDEIIACVCNPVPQSPDASNLLTNPGFEEVYERQGTWTSNTITFTTTNVGSTLITWDDLIQAGTLTVTGSASFNGGVFTEISKGAAIPGVTSGMNLASSNLQVRFTLTGTGVDAGVYSSFVGEAQVIVRGAGTNPDLHYELNTMPGITIDDRSPNNNDGTMSYPVPLGGIAVTLGNLTPTRVDLSAAEAIGVPEIVSAVTASAVLVPLSSLDPGTGLPFGDLVADWATGFDLPIAMIWGFIFLLVSIAIGAWVTRWTDSPLFGGITMLGIFSLGIVIGTGLVQPWILILAIPIAIVIVWMRRFGFPS